MARDPGSCGGLPHADICVCACMVRMNKNENENEFDWQLISKSNNNDHYGIIFYNNCLRFLILSVCVCVRVFNQSVWVIFFLSFENSTLSPMIIKFQNSIQLEFNSHNLHVFHLHLSFLFSVNFIFIKLR